MSDDMPIPAGSRGACESIHMALCRKGATPSPSLPSAPRLASRPCRSATTMPPTITVTAIPVGTGRACAGSRLTTTRPRRPPRLARPLHRTGLFRFRRPRPAPHRTHPPSTCSASHSPTKAAWPTTPANSSPTPASKSAPAANAPSPPPSAVNSRPSSSAPPTSPSSSPTAPPMSASPAGTSCASPAAPCTSCSTSASAAAASSSPPPRRAA